MNLTVASFDVDGAYKVQIDVDQKDLLAAVETALALYGIRMVATPDSVVFRKEADPDLPPPARLKEFREDVLDQSRWLHVEVSRLWEAVAPQSEDLDQLFRDFDRDVQELLEGLE